MQTYRQGDVLVIRIDGPPSKLGDEVPRVKADRVILALGEATGHHHHIRAKRPHCKLFALHDSTDRFLSLKGAAKLLHEEHAPVALPAGDYVVRIQEEYHPAELRKVVD